MFQTLLIGITLLVGAWAQADFADASQTGGQNDLFLSESTATPTPTNSPEFRMTPTPTVTPTPIEIPPNFTPVVDGAKQERQTPRSGSTSDSSDSSNQQSFPTVPPPTALNISPTMQPGEPAVIIVNHLIIENNLNPDSLIHSDPMLSDIESVNRSDTSSTFHDETISDENGFSLPIEQIVIGEVEWHDEFTKFFKGMEDETSQDSLSTSTKFPTTTDPVICRQKNIVKPTATPKLNIGLKNDFHSTPSPTVRKSIQLAYNDHNQRQTISQTLNSQAKTRNLSVTPKTIPVAEGDIFNLLFHPDTFCFLTFIAVCWSALFLYIRKKSPS